MMKPRTIIGIIFILASLLKQLCCRKGLFVVNVKRQFASVPRKDRSVILVEIQMPVPKLRALQHR